MPDTVDFETTLNRYKSNMTEYKATGNTGIKAAADADKQWLDNYVNALQQQSQMQQSFIQNFMTEYQTTNPDLIAMQAQLQKVRQKGPELQDLYETEKRAEEEEPIDYTPYYIKGALIAGVLGVVALVSVLRPVYTI